jgi:hypothetical protein
MFSALLDVINLGVNLHMLFQYLQFLLVGLPFEPLLVPLGVHHFQIVEFFLHHLAFLVVALFIGQELVYLSVLFLD